VPPQVQDPSNESASASASNPISTSRAAREACGLTAERLSEATGISLDRVREIDAGAWPSACETLAWFVACSDNWEALPDDDEKLFLRLERLVKPVSAARKALICAAFEKICSDAERELAEEGFIITPQTPVSKMWEWLTVEEFSKHTRISRNVVYDAVRTGQLPSKRFAGRQIRIPRSVLLDEATLQQLVPSEERGA
jgi:excisionase family DNA binding protein